MQQTKRVNQNSRYLTVVKNSLRDLESLLLAYGPQPSFDDMGWYVRDFFPGNEKVYDTVSDVVESIFFWKTFIGLILRHRLIKTRLKTGC